MTARHYLNAHTQYGLKEINYTPVELLKPMEGVAFSMAVYSLTNPASPALIRTLNQDIPSINYVHDMYVRNDTIFASAGYQGLRILRLNTNNTFSSLGSLTTYPGSGYNHSSFLTSNAQTLVLPMKYLPVCLLSFAILLIYLIYKY